jgi:WhiB family redox-sensing transcriptional regulator
VVNLTAEERHEEMHFMFEMLEKYFIDGQDIENLDELVWGYLEEVYEYVEILLVTEHDFLGRRKIEMFCSKFDIRIPHDYKDQTRSMGPKVKEYLVKPDYETNDRENSDTESTNEPKVLRPMLEGGFIVEKTITISTFPVEPDKNWQDLANCKGVDPMLFYPERGESTRESKEVCKGCEVRYDCLEFALQNGEKFGIWGGLSERERRRIRRRRATASRLFITK